MSAPNLFVPLLAMPIGSLTFGSVASVVGLGFLPIAEGNVAVPVGLALGMSPFSVVSLSVLGTTTQTLLTRGLANWLLTLPPMARWWERRLTGWVGRLFTRKEAIWVVLVGIPWLGGVPTALGAQLAGISQARYARWAVGGLVLHAVTLALSIRWGLHVFAKR